MKKDPETPTMSACSGCRNISCKSSAAGSRPFRWTKTRTDVYQTIFKHGDYHFSVDDVFQELSASESTTSLASVYNSLSVFAEHGIIRRLPKIGNRTYFDTSLTKHAHVYDLNTGELSDFEPEKADSMTKELNNMVDSFSHIVLFQ